VHALTIEHHQWYANEKSSGLLSSLWMVILYWRLWIWAACSVIFLVVLSRVTLDLLLKPAQGADELPEKPTPRSVHYVFGALFVIILGLGLFTPELIDELFDQVACQVVGEWSGAL
jgi:hypothetical protein